MKGIEEYGKYTSSERSYTVKSKMEKLEKQYSKNIVCSSWHPVLIGHMKRMEFFLEDWVLIQTGCLVKPWPLINHLQ